MNVLCIGEMLYDCIETEEFLEDGDVHISYRRFVGGAPANVAIALHKLGTKSAFLGALSTDETGHALMAVLKLAGVDVSYVQQVADAPTRTVRLQIDESGERTFLDFFGEAPETFADTRLEVPANVEKMLAEYHCIVIGSLLCAYDNTRYALFQLLRVALRAHSPIIYDVNRRSMFWPAATEDQEYHFSLELAHYATVIKATAQEAEWLWDYADPAYIMRKYPQLEAVVITNGDQPIQYQIGSINGEIVAPDMAVVDTTGAGDAFTAALTDQFVRAGSFRNLDAPRVDAVMRFAAAAGALATKEFGALNGLPTAYEIEEFLRSPEL